MSNRPCAAPPLSLFYQYPHPPIIRVLLCLIAPVSVLLVGGFTDEINRCCD
jgi:hypothetical protein